MKRPKQSGMAFNPRDLFPRLLHFGVSYGDLKRVTEAATDWDSWSTEFGDLARDREIAAEAAEREDRLVSAAQFWKLACIYYHYSQLRIPIDELKFDRRRKSTEAFRHFAAVTSASIERFELSVDSATLPGYWLGVKAGAPLVILIGGLDSAKEVELYSFAQSFLQRGLQCCIFDGPGQGELFGKFPLNLKFESVLSRVVDHCCARLSPPAIGVFGVSMGGFLAARGAAADDRVRSCISIGGFFDTSVLTRLSGFGKEVLRCALGADETAISQLASCSVADLTPQMARPLFVIHGTRDHLVEDTQIVQFESWTRGSESRIWRVEGAEHVCTDRLSECLPVMGDWMSDVLMRECVRERVPA